MHSSRAGVRRRRSLYGVAPITQPGKPNQIQFVPPYARRSNTIFPALTNVPVRKSASKAIMSPTSTPTTVGSTTSRSPLPGSTSLPSKWSIGSGRLGGSSSTGAASGLVVRCLGIRGQGHCSNRLRRSMGRALGLVLDVMTSLRLGLGLGPGVRRQAPSSARRMWQVG
jgi:hypothetical protein